MGGEGRSDGESRGDGGGDGFNHGFEVEERGVDVDRADGAGEGGGLARAVEAVALGDGVLLAFGGAAAGALGWVGVEEEAEIGVREDNGSDVAAFHYEAGETVAAGDGGLVALVGEQGGADGGQGGEVGDVGVDGGAAELGFGNDTTPDLHQGSAALDAGAEGEGGEGSLDGRKIGGSETGAEQLGGEGAVVGAGVHVQEVEALAEGAGGGGFAGGGSAVDGDDEERWHERMTNDQ